MKTKTLSFTTEVVRTTVKIDRETFLQCLMKNLIESKNKNPDKYRWESGVDSFLVFKRLVESLETDTFSRHCEAIKWTCLELKINCDRKTINSIFKGEKL